MKPVRTLPCRSGPPIGSYERTVECVARRMTRTRSMALNAVSTVLSCAACASALLLPAGIPVWALAGYLVLATMIGAVGTLIGGPPAIALAESMAPADARCRYLG